MILAHHLPSLLDSGSSSVCQTLEKVPHPRRWKRLRTSAFSISFSDLTLQSEPRAEPRVAARGSAPELLAGGDASSLGATGNMSLRRASFWSLEPSGEVQKTTPRALGHVLSDLMLEDRRDGLLQPGSCSSTLRTVGARLGRRMLHSLGLRMEALESLLCPPLTRSPTRSTSWSRLVRISVSSGRTSCSNQEMRGCCSRLLSLGPEGCCFGKLATGSSRTENPDTGGTTGLSPRGAAAERSIDDSPAAIPGKAISCIPNTADAMTPALAR
mmetsp:Transcript_113988/g.333132  ORF Transcript_113988/g.333132 Transcript_113988/m.333132 type:complete len:270 (+) Transcript_113988:266-1075(+)